MAEIKPHGSPGKLLTAVCRTKREVGRLRRLYRRSTKGSPGPHPPDAVFEIQAKCRLNLKNQVNAHKGQSEESGKKRNAFRSRAYRAIRTAANWEDLMRGLKAFDHIKDSGSGVCARYLQRRLSISKETLERLPMPSPFVFKRKVGREIRYVFERPSLAKIRSFNQYEHSRQIRQVKDGRKTKYFFKCPSEKEIRRWRRELGLRT